MTDVYGPPLPLPRFTLPYSAIDFAATFPAQDDARPALAAVCISFKHGSIYGADGFILGSDTIASADPWLSGCPPLLVHRNTFAMIKRLIKKDESLIFRRDDAGDWFVGGFTGKKNPPFIELRCTLLDATFPDVRKIDPVHLRSPLGTSFNLDPKLLRSVLSYVEKSATGGAGVCVTLTQTFPEGEHYTPVSAPVLVTHNRGNKRGDFHAIVMPMVISIDPDDFYDTGASS